MSVDHQLPHRWTGRHDPEDGEMARRLHHLCTDGQSSRALIGFACDAGVARNKGRTGAAAAPAAIRSALANLAAPAGGMPFTDLGDIHVAGDDVEAGQTALGAAIANALIAQERVVVLGGGHETAFGSYLGLRGRFPEAKIGIINFDAHLDLRAPGPNGPSSGTPFFQIREREQHRFAYLCLGMAPESNTQALIARAEGWGVQILRDDALRHAADAAHGVIDRLIDHADIVYLTIDMDVLPHFQAPGVSAPAARGVPLAVVEDLLGHIRARAHAQDVPVPVVDVVEVCPALDRDNVTAKTAACLIRPFLVG